MTPYSSDDSPAIDSSAPTGSSRGAEGSRESGTRNQPPIRPMVTMGRLTRKTEPHQKWLKRKPPVTGPRPMPSAETPAQMPMAFPRSIGLVKTLVSMDSVDGMMNAPPMPMNARVAMRTDAEPLNADRAEPVPKMVRPSASAR